MGSLRIAVATPFAELYSETFVAAHVKGLHRVELLLTGSTLPLEVQGEGPLLRAGAWGRLLDRVEALLRGGGLNHLLRQRIARLLKQRRIQVVLAEYGTTADRMLPICRAAGIPLVAHFHGFDAFKTAIREEHGQYRDLLREAQRVVVPSAHMARHLEALGADASRMEVVPCGVDLDRFTPADPALSGPQLLAVGRFVPKKAMSDVVRAFQIVRAQCPGAHLTLVGDGPEQAAVAALIDQLGLRQAVTLAGAQPHAAVSRLMQDSRMLVQASAAAPDGDHEGTPVVVLEAMASGLPVVGTRHAGIPEVVEHGVSGLLAPEHDIAGLAAHAIDLIDHPERARAMGRAGRATIEQRLGLDRTVGRLQEVLAQAVADYPG